jgi:hypothetical protein
MRSRMARLMAVVAIALAVGLPMVAPVTASAQARPQEVIYGATFQFDPGVTELDRYDVIEGIRLGQLAIASYLGIPNLPNLRIHVLNAADSDSDTTLASTFGSQIEVYTGSEIWRSLAPIERVETLVHELVHVYQNLMIENATEPELLWFAEGSADALGFQAIFSLGVTDQAEVYNLMSYMLTKYPLTAPLSQFEGYGSMDADAYPVAYMAVQYLLGSRGLSVAAIGDVYEGLAAGKTFAQAFETAFGVSLPDFYAEFEAWRPGIVQTAVLDDDFWVEDEAPPVSALALDSVPAQVSASGQLIVSGQATPDVACDLAVVLGTTTIQRPAAANGAGEVYWLISMPEGTAVGSGSLTASCGGAPVNAAFAVAG